MSSIILSQSGVAHPSAIAGAKAFYWSNAPGFPLPTTNLARRFAADLGVTKDGGNLVSAWVDQQASGHDLVQANGAQQPLWAANQFGTLPGITLDGADDYMAAALGTISKPTTVYMLVNQLTWTDNDTFLNSLTGFEFQVYQDGSTPAISFFPGAGGPALATLPEATNGIAMFLANGTSSATRYNLNAATVGGDASVNDMAGLVLGAASGASGWINARIGEILIYQAAHNTAQQDAVIRYLAQRGGVTV